jgi:cyanophycinase
MKRWIARFGLGLLFAAGAPAAADRGHLVLIGGGEKPPEVMEKFIELAGGKGAPIAIVPTASTEPDAIPYYLDLFRKEYGCSDVVAVDIRGPADARRPELLAAIERARGVFFGGGDQVRILSAFHRSPALAAVRGVYERGGVVGGTSAGAACQTPRMITGGGDFTVVRRRAVELWEGLGLWPGVIIDQHHIVRQRFNRLLSAVLEHPEELGVGVDEETAVWVKPDGTFEVMGRSAVVVLDARGAAVSSQARDTGQDSLGVHGLELHVLLPGERYDVARRAVLPPAARP